MKLFTPISQPEHSATQFVFRRIRKGFTYTAILSFSLISIHTLAQSKTTYAHVTSVTPIYETLTIREPYQECHLEKHIKKKAVQHHHNHHTRSSATPTIIGALIGGAIGNELGHNKSNKKVGAVAGAILAGSIANDLTSRTQAKHHSARNAYNTYKPRNSRKYRTEKVCETHYLIRHEKQVSGYDVGYRYHGQRYNTVMNAHPGDRLQVAVDVTPIDY